MSNNFRVGDTVRVKNASDSSGKLVVGDLYVIEQVFSEYVRIKAGGLWFHERFELAPAKPSTNSAAALKAVDIGGIHQKVLDCLRLFPGQEASSSEIEHATKLKAHKRMPELERLGKVVRAGKKKWEGRSVTVWRAAA